MRSLPAPSRPLLCCGAAIVIGDAAGTAIMIGRGLLPAVGAVGVVVVVALAAATLSTAWRPMHGAMATVIIWLIASCLPPTLAASTPMLLLNLLFAVALGLRESLTVGAAMLNAGLLCPLTVEGIAGNLSLDGIAIALVMLACLDAALAAVALTRRRARRERERQSHADRMMREDLVRTLHDDVANRLSYTALRLEQHDGGDDSDDSDDSAAGDAADPARTGEARGEYAALAREVRDALEHTRQAVTLLDRNQRHEPPAPAPRRAAPWLTMLRNTVANEAERARMLGFDGVTLLPDDAPTPMDERRAELLCALVGELFADLVKYADARHGYVLTVHARPSAVTMSFSDTARDEDQRAERRAAGSRSTGIGLDRYRTRLEREGGGLTVEREGRQWTATAVIPA